MNSSDRELINTRAGRRHELAREILGVDWYDTESQARRAIERMVEIEEGSKPPADWELVSTHRNHKIYRDASGVFQCDGREFNNAWSAVTYIDEKLSP